MDFLLQQLPEDIFFKIQKGLQEIYVDIDGEDNLEEKMGFCNQCLSDTNILLQLDFDDTYYAGVYFLSVISTDLLWNLSCYKMLLYAIITSFKM